MDRTPARILFVDDHEDTLDLFALALSQQDYRVVTASTLKRALEETKTQQFDLLVLDSRLTDGSGVDLCRRIREMDHTTPILFCSGLAYQNNKQEALEAGAQAYLVKPIDIDEMCETISRLILASAKDRRITHRAQDEHLARRGAPQLSVAEG